LSGDTLVMPLARGYLGRLSLQEGAKPESGPQWRARWADRRNLGHVVALSATGFLVTDGAKTLTRYTWPANSPSWRDEAKAVLPATVSAAPVLVSPDLVCVALGDGSVALLDTRNL